MNKNENEFKDSLDFKMSSRPNSQEINKRYNNLKRNLSNNPKQILDDDIVNFDNTDLDFKKTNKKSKTRDGLSPITKQNKNEPGPNSNKKVSAIFGKLLIDKSIANNLRNMFQRSLGKLNDNDTKEVGFQELKTMISSNNTAEALRIYLSLLSVNYNNCSQSAKEIQVLLIGYIASVFKENLIDPLDKPPNLIKTIVRVLQIVHSYLKEKSIVIHKACSLSLQEIFDNCMAKEDIAGIILIFFDPLISLTLSGTNTFAQIGASICLSDLISHIGMKNEKENNKKILIALDEKIINMSIKNKNHNQYVFEALFNLMDLIPFESFTNHLKEIYERLINCLNFKKSNYQTKIIALRIFTLIGKKLKSYVNILVGFYYNEIILTLENCSTDRIHKVQLAANEALKEWRELQAIHEDVEKKKTQLDPKVAQMNNENLILNYKKMDKFNLLRNLSKFNKNNEDTTKQSHPYAFLTENLKEEIYKKGIGNVLKLSNLLKNKSQSNSDFKNSLHNKKNLVRTPTQKVNEEINDYLKKSMNTKKSNSNGFALINYEELNLEGDKRGEREEKINHDDNQIRKGVRTDDYTNRKSNKLLKEEVLIIDKKDKSKFSEKNSENNNNSKINYIAKDEDNYNTYKNDDEEDKSISKLKDNNSIVIANKNSKNDPDFEKISKNISLLFKSSFKACDAFQTQINTKLDKLEHKLLQTFNKIHKMQNTISKSKPEIEIKECIRCSSINNNKYNSGDQINQGNQELINQLKREIQKSNNKEKESPSVEIWKNSIKEMNNKNYEVAFSKILETGDDIYLLRLLCVTGIPIINKISITTFKKIIMRINLISRTHQIQSILLNLIQISFDNFNFFKFNNNEQNELLETLYEFSGINSNIGTQAASLYTKITSLY